MPRWQFQPLRRMEHALLLIDKANGQYTLTKAPNGVVTAQVSIGKRSSSASYKSAAAAITVALAQVLGIELAEDFA